MQFFHISEWKLFGLQIVMPFNCLGVLVGDTDADNAVGPPNVRDKVLLTETGAYMQTEDGFDLEFEF